jgi:hypothetical protein
MGAENRGRQSVFTGLPHLAGAPIFSGRGSWVRLGGVYSAASTSVFSLTLEDFGAAALT